MRSIVSAKIEGTNKRIIGYLIEIETGHFVSTYSVPTINGTQLTMGLEKIDYDSIVYLMNEREIKGELN